MMLVGVLQLVTVLAAATSYLTLRGTMTPERSLNEAVGGLVSMFLWGLVSYGAMDIESVGAGGVIRDSSPGFAMIAVGLAGLMLVVSLVGTTALVDVRDVEPDQWSR